MALLSAFLFIILLSNHVKGIKYNVGYPLNYRGAVKLRLFLTTSELEDVPFAIDSLKGYNKSGLLSRNSSITLDIPLSFEVVNKTERYKGIRVISMDNREMRVFVQSHRSSGMFSALPCLGQNLTEYVYYTISWEKDNIIPLPYVPQLLLVGCEDNTTVSIGSDEVVTLNEMETFLAHSSSSYTGTKIVSNKPVSVISSHECANIPNGVRFCDYIIEQFPNTAQWGNNFLTSPLQGRTAPDIYTIVPSLPLTNVTFFCTSNTSSTLTTISKFPNNHKVVIVPDRAYCSIKSNHPIQLAQFASSHEADLKDGDPFMTNVVPVRHYSNYYTVVVPPEFPESVISIFILPEYFQPDKVFVDGESVVWTPIPCHNQSVCGYCANVVNVTDGQHTIHHEDYLAKLAVLVYGFIKRKGYGYSEWQLEQPNSPHYITISSSFGREGFPTISPIYSPTASPTSFPSASSTSPPTASPSSFPTASTSPPTASPSSFPTASSTSPPTASPSSFPTASTSPPTASPSSFPTASSTSPPTASPSSFPTASSTSPPTASPSTVSSYVEVNTINLLVLLGAALFVTGVSCGLLVWLVYLKIKASFNMFQWYKVLLVSSVFVTVFSSITWIVYVVYLASDGLYYDNGMIQDTDTPRHEEATPKTSILTVVVFCFILSLLTTLLWLFAILFLRCGLIRTRDQVQLEGSSMLVKLKNRRQETPANSDPSQIYEEIDMEFKNIPTLTSDEASGDNHGHIDTSQNVAYGGVRQGSSAISSP